MFVGQYMSQNLISVGPRTTHREALTMMREQRIRRLPVIDGDKLVGIISEKDLLSTAPSPATTLSVYEIYTLLDRLTVEKIMTTPVITVQDKTPMQDAAKIMIERKIGCLPVMRGDKLVGIITETDIMRVLVGLLGGGEPGTFFTVRLRNEPGALAAVLLAVAQSGGNVITITTLRPAEGSMGDVAIKERGADEAKLREALQQAGAEVVEFASGAAAAQMHGVGR